jgi:hypothetical protein
VNVAQGDEAAHEETGSDEEGERDGNFEDNYGVAEATVGGAAAGAFAAVAEGIIEIAAHHLEGRCEAEDDGGEHGDNQGEGENGEIEANDGFGGNDARRHERDEAFESSPCKDCAEYGSADREKEALDQELTNDAPAAGSQSGADGEFFLASGGAREEKIGDVAATYQEEETDGSENDV